MLSKFCLYVIMNLFLLFNTIDTCSPSFFYPIESAPSLTRAPSASNIVLSEKAKIDVDQKKEAEEDGKKIAEERRESGTNIIKSLICSILQKLKF